MLVFPPAATGTDIVAAYFGGLATEGDLCILCIIVHGWRVFDGGLRGSGGHGWLGYADPSYIERDLGSGRRRCGGFLDDEEGGF